MGNKLGLEEWDIKFVQTMQDPNFGMIDIYKNQTGKYVMMLKRTFIKNDQDRGVNQFMEMLEFAKDSEGLNTKRSFEQGEFVTPILHSQKIIQNNFCIAYQIYDTYCEYFNFTLKDMVVHRKDMDVDELWLCFYWMIRFANFLSEKKWRIIEGITLDKIFITLKGLPTVSIHHLTKIREEDDFVLQKDGKQQLREISLCMLQLICMTEITAQENLELYFRKAQKISRQMGAILSKILRKTFTRTTTATNEKISQTSILQEITKLVENKKVTPSREIKLNKFKYIIPKPQIKLKTFESPPKVNNNNKQEHFRLKDYSENQKNDKNSKNSDFFEDNSKKIKTEINENEKNAKVKDIAINTLQGRKSKGGGGSHNSSMRDSQKSSIITLIEQNKNSTLPVGGLAALKTGILASQIENRKKQSSRQLQKLLERKQMMMGKGSSLHGKENILENSIGQVKPSKHSWARKAVVNEQMKNSQKRNKIKQNAI